MTGAVLTFNPLLYLIVPAAFILGSIPFGLLFTRGTGIDIRSSGSRNIGATNVLRSAGKKPAILTLLFDLLKGTAAVLVCKAVIDGMDMSAHSGEFVQAVHDFWPGIAALSAVSGHMFSLFLSFKGGKGVATGFGVMLAYSPGAAGIMLCIWLAVAFAFKYSSLAAVSAATALPFVLLLMQASAVKISTGLLISALIVYKHIPNIRNLLKGEESRIGKKTGDGKTAK